VTRVAPVEGHSVTASGAGSVAAGRDIVRSLIATGDHNQFFVGGYEPLKDCYIDPWSVYDRVRLDRFAGRDWLIREIDNFLRGHDRGYLVLEAEAGLGKTTLLAWLARNRGYPHHFSELEIGPDRLHSAIKSLAAQVIRAYLSEEDINQVLPSAAARPDYLLKLLRLASGRRREGEKIVLIIDALDESEAPAGRNVLGLPQVLPSGVFIVASQRPVPVRLQVDTTSTPRHLLRVLKADSPDNLADMRQFLARATRWPGIRRSLAQRGYTGEQFVETLLRKCGGVWIYLHFIVHEIERGGWSSLVLEKLPNGLTQYFIHYWQRWRDSDPGRWYNLYLPLISGLAAAREPVAVEDLIRWKLAHASEPLVNSLLAEQWRPFLAVSDPGPRTRYSLYHAAVREFMEGRVTRDDLLSSEVAFVDELAGATRAAHGVIADAYLDRWGGLQGNLGTLRGLPVRDEPTRYGLRNLSAHLEAAGRLGDLHTLLGLLTPCSSEAPADPDLNAYRPGAEFTWFMILDKEGDVAAYLADIARAWASVDRECMRAPSPTLIGLQCRYALITSTINSLAGNIDRGLLARLLETGLWTAPRVMAYARRMPDSKHRFRTLLDLARLKGSHQDEARREAVAEAEAIPAVEPRARALTELIPLLRGSERARVSTLALDAAARIEDAWHAADVLLRLAPRLYGAHFASAMAQVRARCTPLFAQPPTYTICRVITGTCRPTGYRGVLRVVASVVEEIDAAMELAAIDPGFVLRTIFELDAPVESVAIHPRFVLRTAVEVLAFLALAAEERSLRRAARRLGRALNLYETVYQNTHVNRNKNRIEGIRACLAGVRDLALSGAIELPEAAIWLYRVGDPGYEVVGYNWRLVEHLPKRLLGTVLDKCLRHESDPNKATMLASLAPYLTEDLLRQALRHAECMGPYWAQEAISGIDGFYLHGHGRMYLDSRLRGLGPNLPAPDCIPFLLRAADAYRTVGDEFERGLLFGKLAQLASEPDVEFMIINIYKCINLLNYYHNTEKFDILEYIASLVDGKSLSHSIRVIQVDFDPYQRIRVMVVRAMAQPEPNRSRLLRKALRTASTIRDPISRLEYMSYLVSRLRGRLRRACLSRILVDVAHVPDHLEGFTVQCLRQIIPYLPASLIDSLDRTVESISVAEDRREISRLWRLRARSLQRRRWARKHSESACDREVRDLARTMRILEINDRDERKRRLGKIMKHIGGLTTPQVAVVWVRALHRSALRSRADLLGDLAALSPLVRSLGGPASITELARSLQVVAHCWP